MPRLDCHSLGALINLFLSPSFSFLSSSFLFTSSSPSSLLPSVLSNVYLSSASSSISSSYISAFLYLFLFLQFPFFFFIVISSFSLVSPLLVFVSTLCLPCYALVCFLSSPYTFAYVNLFCILYDALRSLFLLWYTQSRMVWGSGPRKVWVPECSERAQMTGSLWLHSGLLHYDAAFHDAKG